MTRLYDRGITVVTSELLRQHIGEASVILHPESARSPGHPGRRPAAVQWYAEAQAVLDETRPGRRGAGAAQHGVAGRRCRSLRISKSSVCYPLGQRKALMNFALILEWLIKGVRAGADPAGRLCLPDAATSARRWPASRCASAPTAPVRGACCSPSRTRSS